MRSLGNSLHNAFPTTGFTFNNPHSPCSDEIGNLPSWLKTAARRSLKAVAESIVSTTKRIVADLDENYSRTMARTPLEQGKFHMNHENMFESGLIPGNEC